MKGIYKDAKIVVYTNDSGEIFVQPKKNQDATIRIGPNGNGLIITAHDGTLVPWAENGLSAIQVEAGRPKTRPSRP